MANLATPGELQAGLSGIMGEAFRDMVSERTHAALASRAFQGRPAGGKRYGYKEGEAETVRQIFKWYALGNSPQWIAAELNRRGVASPGAAWNRTTRRRGGWHPSAIGGDPSRGIGILNNEAYIGRTIWNRSKWLKDPDTGKRRCVVRRSAEWIIHEDESARIIPQQLWDQAKVRQRLRSNEAGERIAAGKRSSGGKRPRYLLSGLMRCESCGSSFVMTNGERYACAGHTNGRVCDIRKTVRRDLLEDRLLASIRSSLLTDEAIERFRVKFRRQLQQRPADPGAKRRKDLETEIGNISNAIAKGLFSSTMARRLHDAEAELAAIPPPSIVELADDLLRRLPQAVARFRAMANKLGDAPVDMERARAVLKSLLGPILMSQREGYLVAKMGLELQPLSVCNRGSGGRI